MAAILANAYTHSFVLAYAQRGIQRHPGSVGSAYTHREVHAAVAVLGLWPVHGA